MPDQRSTTDQLQALYALANRNGLYDAADVVRGWLDDRARFRAERSGQPVPKPTQVFDPAKVRELVAAAKAVCDGTFTAWTIARLGNAVLALRDGEGE
jgi:hypothetical protein